MAEHAPQDSLGILASIEAFPDQCAQVIHDVAVTHVPSECFLASNIVVSGMGGSGLGGRVVVSLERQTLKIPIIVSTEYHLPNFVGPRTLVIISSYSGNTEETLAALTEARARNAQIFVLASGGQLAQLAQEYHLPHYIFDPKSNPSSQPRMGLGYNTLGILAVLSRCQLIHPLTDLHQMPDYLRSLQTQTPDLTHLAGQLAGRIPVIIASEHLKGSAHAMKNQFNENSKTFAAYFDLPELNHHLLEGLSFPKTNPKNLSFIFIQSDRYHPELKKIYPVTRQAIIKQHIPVHELTVSGPSALFESLGLIQTGATLAFHLAAHNAVDPGPIPWVDWYKDEIRKMV